MRIFRLQLTRNLMIGIVNSWKIKCAACWELACLRLRKRNWRKRTVARSNRACSRSESRAVTCRQTVQINILTNCGAIQPKQGLSLHLEGFSLFPIHRVYCNVFANYEFVLRTRKWPHVLKSSGIQGRQELCLLIDKWSNQIHEMKRTSFDSCTSKSRARKKMAVSWARVNLENGRKE